MTKATARAAEPDLARRFRPTHAVRQGGKRVLRVPLKAVLHAEHAMVAPGLREYLQSTSVDDLDALAIFLIRERADPTSPWSVPDRHCAARGWPHTAAHAMPRCHAVAHATPGTRT